MIISSPVSLSKNLVFWLKLKFNSSKTCFIIDTCDYEDKINVVNDNYGGSVGHFFISFSYVPLQYHNDVVCVTNWDYETLGHGQVGLSPGSGSLTTSEDTAPDGAASTRSLFKLGWSSASTGGSTTTWSKIHGTMYWGQGVGYASVELQDKDGNIFWNSNP